MNEVFGNFFDVSKSEIFERQASDKKFPKPSFISDIPTIKPLTTPDGWMGTK